MVARQTGSKAMPETLTAASPGMNMLVSNPLCMKKRLRPIPMIPPITVDTRLRAKDSAATSPRMRHGEVPIAFRIPNSLIRSNVDMSMVFITPRAAARKKIIPKSHIPASKKLTMSDRAGMS